MNIRYQVDAYDEKCLFNDKASSDADSGGPIARSHVCLGSLENIIHLGSYTKKLGKVINLQTLTTFLRLNRVISVGEHTISSFKV